MKSRGAKCSNHLDLFDRPPPRNLEAERAVLGSILLKPDVADVVRTIVSADDFYDEAHQRLFGHITTMVDNGQKPDEVTLVEQLRVSGDLEVVGGYAALAQFFNFVPTAGNAVYYAGIVREKAQLRTIICEVLEAASDAYGEQVASHAVANRLAQRLDKLQDSPDRTKLLTASAAVDQALAVARASLVGQRRRGLPTGLGCFDRTIGGLFPGELAVCAARPGNGKTALGLQIAAHNAGRGSPVLFVSCEMSASELANRLLCAEGEVDVDRVRTCSLSIENLDRLEAEGDHWRTQPLMILDGPASSADVGRVARRLRRFGGLSLIVVDYLQKLLPADRSVKRYEQVGALSADLKRIARELDIPMLCLAQLSREVESAAHCQPRLSHLRESGDIEQDADLVGLLHQPWLYTRDPDHRGQAEMYVAKNRHGPTAQFALRWDGPRTRFHEPDSDPATSEWHD